MTPGWLSQDERLRPPRQRSIVLRETRGASSPLMRQTVLQRGGWFMKAIPKDLPERVAAACDRGCEKSPELAERFGVSASPSLRAGREGPRPVAGSTALLDRTRCHHARRENRRTGRRACPQIRRAASRRHHAAFATNQAPLQATPDQSARKRISRRDSSTGPAASSGQRRRTRPRVSESPAASTSCGRKYP